MKKTLTILSSALLAFGISACSTDLEPTTNPAPDTSSNQESQSTEPTVESVEPEAKSLTKSDFKIDLDVVDKQCFGSAGCNVVVEPDLSVDLLALEASGEDYEIRVKISGDESGPIIQTIYAFSDGTYSYDSVLLSTPSNSTEVKIKITKVEAF